MRLLLLPIFLAAFSVIAGEHNAGDAKNPRETDTIVRLHDGLVFDGVRISLQHGSPLRGVDAATGKQLWSISISSFWNRVRVVEKEIEGVKTWLLELHPYAGTDQGSDKRQYHDLRTGKEVVMPVVVPAGELLGPAQVIGVETSLGRHFVALLSTRENFEAFWARAHGPKDAGKSGLDENLLSPGINVPDGNRRKMPPVPEIDFSKNVALVFNVGDCFNSHGKNQQGIWIDDERVLMRFSTSGYQSFGGAHLRRVCEVFILPRHEKRRYDIELNVQNIIRGPEIWERIESFGPVKGDAAEIASFVAQARPCDTPVPADFQRAIEHAAPKKEDEEFSSSFFGRQTYDFYRLHGAQVIHGPFMREKKYEKGWISVAEGSCIDGVQDGVWLYRASSGMLREQKNTPTELERILVTYDRGVRHGLFEVKDKNGFRALVGSYENGLPHGLWTVTHDDGTQTTYPFVRGLYHGDLQRINAAGDITWKQSYEMGLKKE